MPISPIGNRIRGFTLLEMLVVLTIIGVLTAMGAPLYGTIAARMKNWSVNHDLLVQLQHAHKLAKMEQKTISVFFDPDQNLYRIGTHSYPLSPGQSLSAQQDGVDEAVIHFYPDGSATPAALTLRNGAARTVIHIDGLTGRVAAGEN